MCYVPEDNINMELIVLRRDIEFLWQWYSRSDRNLANSSGFQDYLNSIGISL